MKSFFARKNLRMANSGTDGMTLIEVLISVGISVILLASFSNMIALQLKSSKQLDDAFDRQSIRSSLLRSVNCQMTIESPGLQPGQDAVLRGKNNKTIGGNAVSGTGTDFDGSRQINGDFYYKAYYSGVSDGLKILLAKRVANTSSWTFDRSINGTTYDFNSSESMPIIGGSNLQYRLCGGLTPGNLQFTSLFPKMSEIGSVAFPPGDIPDYYRPLPSYGSNSGLAYASCLNAQANASNALSGIGGTSLTEYPLYLMYACNKYCKKMGYGAGWNLGCETFRNINGNIVFFGQDAAYYTAARGGVQLSNLDERVACSCIK